MNYHDIVYDDMVNGPGIRVSLFVSGCIHGCEGCYNKKTWNPTSGEPFTDKEFLAIMKYLENDYVHGISLTGGDPLHPRNLSTINMLIDDIRFEHPTKTIWLWSGFTKEQIDSDESRQGDLRREIVSKLDALVDGKFEQELYDPQLQFRGSSNQIIHRFKL